MNSNTELNALRRERKGIVEDMKGMFSVDHDTGQLSADNVDWDDEKNAKYQDRIARINAIDALIEKRQQLAEIGGIEASAEEHIVPSETAPTPEATAEQRRMAFMGGMLPREARVKQLQENGLTELTEQMFDPAMTITTGATASPFGGYTVPSEIADQLVEVRKQFGPLQARASTITVLTDAQLSIPTTDETSQEGEIIAEAANATEQDVVFGRVLMTPDRWTSKLARVSVQFLRSTALSDIESMIFRMMGARIARGQERLIIQGTSVGGADGQGIKENIPNANASRASVAGATGLGRADANLFNTAAWTVDPAYQANAAWVMHPSVISLVSGLSVGTQDGRPLFLPSLADGIGTIAGYPVIASSYMDTIAVNATLAIFGDLSLVQVNRVANSISFARVDSDEKNVVAGTVAFLLQESAAINVTDPNGFSSIVARAT